VFAAHATNGGGCFSDRLFEQRWERQHLAGTAIENGSQPSPEPTILFLPEIHGKNPIPATKERFRDYLWALPI
jgi:hypothetical protein